MARTNSTPTTMNSCRQDVNLSRSAAPCVNSSIRNALVTPPPLKTNALNPSVSITNSSSSKGPSNSPSGIGGGGNHNTDASAISGNKAGSGATSTSGNTSTNTSNSSINVGRPNKVNNSSSSSTSTNNSSSVAKSINSSNGSGSKKNTSTTANSISSNGNSTCSSTAITSNSSSSTITNTNISTNSNSRSSISSSSASSSINSGANGNNTSDSNSSGTRVSSMIQTESDILKGIKKQQEWNERTELQPFIQSILHLTSINPLAYINNSTLAVDSNTSMLKDSKGGDFNAFNSDNGKLASINKGDEEYANLIESIDVNLYRYNCRFVKYLYTIMANDADNKSLRKELSTVQNANVAIRSDITTTQLELATARNNRSCKQKYEELSQTLISNPTTNRLNGHIQAFQNKKQKVDNHIREITNKIHKQKEQALMVLQAFKSFNDSFGKINQGRANCRDKGAVADAPGSLDGEAIDGNSITNSSKTNSNANSDSGPNSSTSSSKTSSGSNSSNGNDINMICGSNK